MGIAALNKREPGEKDWNYCVKQKKVNRRTEKTAAQNKKQDAGEGPATKARNKRGQAEDKGHRQEYERNPVVDRQR